MAGATDWPGLDRWGTSEADALDSCRRTSRAMRRGRAGRDGRRVRVGARHGGGRTGPRSSSTDFWGVAHVPSQIEREVLATPTSSDAWSSCRRAGRLRRHRETCVRGAPARLARRRSDPRRDHPPRYLREADQFSRKVEVRTPFDLVLTPDGRAAHRRAYVEAIRAYNAQGKAARLADPVPHPTDRPPRHGSRVGAGGPGSHPGLDLRRARRVRALRRRERRRQSCSRPPRRQQPDPHRRPGSRRPRPRCFGSLKSRPSADSCQASGSPIFPALEVQREPEHAASQPTPTAPGPYWSTSLGHDRGMLELERVFPRRRSQVESRSPSSAAGARRTPT